MLKKQYAKDIAFITLFSLMVGALNTIFLLHTTFRTFFSEKKEEQVLLKTLQNKENRANENEQVKKSLANWQQKNPDLYQAAQQSPDYFSRSLTNIIQQAGLIITHARPIKNNTLEITAQGNYGELFPLIDALNKNPWPIVLSHIEMKNKNQLSLIFTGST